MFTKVLIPYDFSDDAEYIIRCLRNIPQIRELILVHIVTSPYLVSFPDRENPETEYARLKLEKVKEVIEMPRSRVRIIVGEIGSGDFSDAIVRIADQEQASLIMMGRRGRGVIETLLLGSTAWDILRYGHCSLLLVHPPEKTLQTSKAYPPCPGFFSRIMICTDFSDPEIETLSLDLIPYVQSVDLFHVVSRGDTSSEVETAVKQAEEKLHHITFLQGEKPIPVKAHVTTGDAADEILAYSDRENVSLIMMKSTGRRGIMHRIIGGTTEGVARKAKKPLLILKSG